MSTSPLTQSQIPDHAILDYFNKQVYLGQQFIYSIPTSTIATTSEVPLIYLNNPSTNTKALFQNLKKLTCLTATQAAIFRVYFNPTITSNGTLQTVSNLRPASPNTSVAKLYLSPSVSSNGMYTVGLAGLAFTTNISNVLSILDPGQSLLVTVQATANPTNIEAEISWYEI